MHNRIKIHASKKLKLPEFANYLIFNIFAFWKLLLLNDKISIIHVYPKSILPALLAAKLFKKPLVVDFRDQISVFAKESGHASLKSRFFAFLEKLAIKHADYLFAISDEIKKYLIRHGAKQDITVIPSGVNFDLFDPGKIKKNKRKTLGIPEKQKVILYSGSLDKARNCDKIIDAVALSRQKNKNLHLMLVGDGPDKNTLIRYGKAKLGSNFTATGFVSYNKIPEYINAADLCVCYLKPTKHFKASSPLKIIEYLSMNKPVVATDIAPHYLVKDLNAGLLFNPDSVKDFSKAILKQICKKIQARHKLREYDHYVLASRCIQGYNKAILNFKGKGL